MITYRYKIKIVFREKLQVVGDGNTPSCQTPDLELEVVLEVDSIAPSVFKISG